MSDEITWRRVASIWWLILWRSLVGGLLLGFLVGLVIGVAGALLGWGSSAQLAAGVLGVALGMGWSLFVFKMALRKRYRGFRLELVTDASPGQR